MTQENGRGGDVTRPTRWTQVVRATGTGREAEMARDELCRRFWEPLRGFAISKGWDAEEAQDAVQDFFAEFFGRRGGFSRADPARGRLRSFLLAAFKHSLLNRHAQQSAAKRGGGRANLPLEELAAREAPAVSDSESPDRLFDRRWATTVVAAALSAVEQRWRQGGREEEWEVLGPLLTEAKAGQGECAVAARRLGQPGSTVRGMLHRMRGSYRQALIDQIADTLEAPTEAEIQAELEALMAAFR